MPDILFFQIAVKQVGELIILQPPLGRNEQIGRRLTDKSLQYQRRAQSRKISGNEFDILLYGLDMERLAKIFKGQLGSTDDLHLMNLQYIERQRRYNRRLTNALCCIFAGESKNDVSTT